MAMLSVLSGCVFKLGYRWARSEHFRGQRPLTRVMGRQIDQTAAERFVDLCGHLLVYVNTEYDEITDIETYDERIIASGTSEKQV
jgi:hypothetical protein